MRVRELVTYFGFEVDNDAIDRADRAVDGMKRTLLATVTAGVAVGAAMFGVTRSFANAGDEAAKGAQRVGITTEEYQRLSHAAQLAGTNIGAIEPSLARVARAASDAEQGSKASADAFNRMGISVTQADGRLRPIAELLPEIADAMANAEDPTRAMADAQAILGRGARTMAPLLLRGGDALRDAMSEADLYGAVIGGEAAAQGEKFNDTLFRLRQVALGVRNAFGSRLLPVFQEAADRLHTLFVENRELIQQRLDQWARAAADGLRAAVDWFTRTRDAIARVVERLGGARAVFAQLRVALMLLIGVKLVSFFMAGVAGAMALVTALRTAGIAAVATQAKMMLLPLAIAALGVMAWLVWDDLKAFFDGSDSLIGRFVERFRGAGGVLGWLADTFFDLRDEGGTALRLLIADVMHFGRVFMAVINSIGDVAQAIFQPMIGAVHAMTLAARGRFSEAGTALRSGFEAQQDSLGRASGRFDGLGTQREEAEEQIMIEGARLRTERRLEREENRQMFNIDSDVTVNVDGGGDPDVIAQSVAERVENVFGRALATAERNIGED